MRLVSSWATEPLWKVTVAETSSASRPISACGAGLDVGDLARDHLMHQVEVVDHQVEHGADVGAAAGPRPHAPAGDFLAARRGSRAGRCGRRRNAPGGRPSVHGRSPRRARSARRPLRALVAIGFSTRTWAPELRNARTIVEWVTAGVQMLTRSTLPSSSRQSATACTPWVASERLAHFGIGIGDGDKLDAVEAAILRGVMTAERTGADDGGLERTFVTHAAMGQRRIPRRNQGHKAGRGRREQLIKCFVLLHIAPLLGSTALSHSH